ncbi:beta-lactamase transpeptidase [Fusarium mexicanum]|uniref:Beta-lactamase transpeptidase n=1 Tax=Fusarium mexicanum TaxID=751941 RepID=A0A8H5N834_9HYPO|nr:beta-lactamase transpeptidase [Fusarium mexicanum]
MSTDTVFWMASCTKLMTSIAAMQLVEQGRIGLDSADGLHSFLPELSQLMVLEEEEGGSLRLVKQEASITLRMLLTHTAGFGYSFSNEKLRRWYEPIVINEFDNRECEIFAQPLVNQPGTAWEYGINIDWANLAHLHQRKDDGSIEPHENGHLLRASLIASTEEDVQKTLNSGGAGLFSSPVEYCKIIAMLLNQGKSPTTNKEILKVGTIKEMFSNQIPHLPDFARSPKPSCKPSLVRSAAEIYPQSGNPPQGWGLSFFLLLRPADTGRAAGTAWWSGLANLIWWIDFDKGLGGMLASQVLPFGDPQVVKCQAEMEAAIYQEISKLQSREAP